MTDKEYIITDEQLNQLKHIIKVVHKTRKRKKKEPEPEPEPEPESKIEPWECSGRVWEDPPGPCQPGKRSNVQMSIFVNKKRIIVCKECKLARDRKKSKLARERKKRKLEEENK